MNGKLGSGLQDKWNRLSPEVWRLPGSRAGFRSA